MNTIHTRRWQDRAPLTSRITWAFWRGVSNIEREAPTILGSLVVGSFATFAGAVFLAWVMGA